MMNTRLDQQLSQLDHEMIELGALCEEVIALAASALSSADAALAAQVAPRDKEIDQKERQIEALCLKLLLMQHPVARDLRQISAALKMITDMERIGDQAEDIAEIIPHLDPSALGQQQVLREMAAGAIKMVSDSVEAYVRRSTDLAQGVIDYDDVVDGCFVRVKGRLIRMIAADPALGETALDLLMIAKYFERIADHAVNLAEWVIYAVTGAHKEAAV